MSLPEPITRKEQYYDGIARGNASKLPEPITREEQYLEYIAKNGGGGGGGTTDYEALDNKPSVNSVELSGNKTLDDLDIQGKLTFDNEPTEDSQNPVKSGGVYEALASLNEAISSKPDNYEDLDDKPSINSVELSGNKTASDLGLQPTLDGAQTVEGNPITITDAEPMNAESVKVALEPKQDLHGYDAPWVGGAEKNKLPLVLSDIKSANTSGTWSGNTYTLNGRTFTLIVDDANNVVAIKVGGSTSSYITLDIPFNLPVGEYILSKGGMRARLIKDNDVINDGTDNYTFSVTDINDDYVYALFPGTGSVSDVEVTPMIRLATETDPTFAPYSNICPITGYSEVNLEKVGKNLCDHSTIADGIALGMDGGVYADASACTTDFIRIKAGEDVAFSTGFRWGNVYDLNGNFTTIQFLTTYHAEENCLIRVTFDLSAKSTIQVEYGSITTYEPYQGSTATISLGGTKYGGTLDVTEGEYSDEWGYIEGDSLQDFLNAGYTTTQLGSGVLLCSAWSHAIPAPSGVTPKTMLRCNNLDNVDPETQWSGNISGVCINNQGTIGFTVKDITTQEELDTWLQNNPLQIAFRNGTRKESTTPTDIPLLENTNNISTDGTNIQLKYQPNNVIGECKAYTDEQITKVLPPLPTTDGTYHLSCEVTSGVGALIWVSDS